MTVNDYMTQSQMVELHLKLLENEKIDLKHKHTLDTLLPHSIKKITDNKVLFFNKNGEVIINFINDFLYKINVNEEDYKYFYKKPKNFEYLLIEYKMEKDVIYFYNEKIFKKSIPKYIEKVRAFLALLSN